MTPSIHRRVGLVLIGAGLLLLALVLLKPDPAWAQHPGAASANAKSAGATPAVDGHVGKGGKAADPYAAMGAIRPKTRQPAPAFALEKLGGGTARLGDYAGKVVLINFWATWCGPCVKEMPDLQALWQRYRQDDFALLAINVDAGRMKPVRRFADRHGLSLPIAMDQKGNTRRAYEVIALPTSYLIGRDGKFLGKLMGDRKWNTPKGHRLIEAALSQPAP